MTTSENTAPVELGSSLAGIDGSEFDAYVESRRQGFAEETSTLTLAEAYAKYDLVDAHYDPAGGSYVIMAQRDPGITRDESIVELGYAYQSPFTAWTREEWNPKLRDREGLRQYYKMKRINGIVRGALRMLKTPLQAGHWFIKPGSDSDVDKRIAEFVANNLFNELNVTWSRVLDDILLMCEYGYMVMEKVYEFRSDGKLVLRKLAPRHPLDIREWRYDANGGPSAIVMEPFESNGFHDPIVIPIEKLAVFTLEAEGGDMSGISVLRSAYMHFYYIDTLYKIDAIQKERHAIGVPIIKLPPGFTQADKNLAEELGRNLRTNDRAHVALPPNWEIEFAKLEGQKVNCLESIDHHNQMILANILAPFLTDSSVDPRSTDMFMKSTRYIGATVANVFNRHVIRQLVDLNFALGRDRKYPELVVRRVGEWEDVRTMSFAFRNFVGAGAITPDDVLEKYLREEMDLPAMDPDTSRPIPGVTDPNAQLDQTQGPTDTNAPTPPTPARVGLPRQAAPSTKGVGRTNTGRDSSGG